MIISYYSNHQKQSLISVIFKIPYLRLRPFHRPTPKLPCENTLNLEASFLLCGESQVRDSKEARPVSPAATLAPHTTHGHTAEGP